MGETTIKQFDGNLLKRRRIYLYGDITTNEANKIGRSIIWLNAQNEVDPITLYISSPGGCTDAGLDIYDMVKHSKAPIEGMVYRMANSMAAVILQACRPRIAFRNAEILIHSVSVRKNLSEIEENLEMAMTETRKRQEEAPVKRCVNSESGGNLLRDYHLLYYSILIHGSGINIPQQVRCV